jgi:hypothetical protein
MLREATATEVLDRAAPSSPSASAAARLRPKAAAGRASEFEIGFTR